MLYLDTHVMRERNGISTIRWVIVALAFALGLVLLARGDVVIGALVTAMAVMRIVLLARLRRRREELRERWRERGGFG